MSVGRAYAHESAQIAGEIGANVVSKEHHKPYTLA